MSIIKDNIERIKEDIKLYKSCNEEVLLLAVCKNVSPDHIREAFDGGIHDFGENYLQEVLPKMEYLRDLNIRWHFIGHLQTNKVGKTAENFYMIQSVDSLKLAHLLNSKAEKLKKKIDFLLQIKVSHENTKYGFNLEDLRKEIDIILKLEHVSFKGFMAMAPFFTDSEEARPYFRTVKKLASDVEEMFEIKIPYLSMGMTDDYKVALSEGANLIRIGSGIFGPRSY